MRIRRLIELLEEIECERGDIDVLAWYAHRDEDHKRACGEADVQVIRHPKGKTGEAPYVVVIET